MIKKIILFVSLFFNISIFAGESSFTFSVENHDITAIITDEAFLHMTEGEIRGTTYAGGHDWGFYEERVKSSPTANAYFDTTMNAYIVASEKGDGLIEIIDSLRVSKTPKYHTCFPPKVLTKEFIFASFQKAYEQHHRDLVENRKNRNIDIRHNLFYVEHEDFKIAGHFEKREDNVFAITTCFPDLSWYYRIYFKHHKNDPFLIKRFWQLDNKENAWIRHGNAFLDDTEDTKWWPENRIGLSASFAKDGQGQKVTPEHFTSCIKLFEVIDRGHVEDQKIENLFEFFFTDPKNKTIKEIQEVNLFLQSFVVGYKSRKYKSIKEITDEIDRVARIRKNISVKFQNLDEGGRFSIQKKYTMPHNEFSEAIMYQLLVYNVGSYFKPLDYRSDDATYALAKKVHDNLQKALIHDDIFIRMMKENNLVFDLSHNVAASGAHYQISLFHVKDITYPSFINQEQAYLTVGMFDVIAQRPYDFRVGSAVKFMKKDYEFRRQNFLFK